MNEMIAKLLQSDEPCIRWRTPEQVSPNFFFFWTQFST